MSIYRFSGTSAVKEIAFHYAKDRLPVALLAASKKTDTEQLSAIRKALEKRGWPCVPAYADEKEVLQVGGFKNELELNDFLRLRHFIDGKAEIIKQPGDNPKLTGREKLQSISLKIAGGLNLVGDAWALKNGISRKDPYWKVGGSLYTVGGLVALLYGNTPKEKFLREVSEQTSEFLEKKIGDLEKDSALEHVFNHRKNGPAAKFQRYMHRHAADVMLGAYAAGAVPILANGTVNWRNSGDWKGDWSDAAYGGFSLLVKSTALLTPEKIKAGKGDQQAHSGLIEKEGIWEKFKKFICHPIRWFTQQPLRIFGGGSLVSELLLANRSYQANKAGKKQGMDTWVCAVAYLLSDGFAMISKKSHVNAEGRFDADQQRNIEASVAEAIMAKPETQREEFANQAGGFLAGKAEINGSAGDISKSILEQMKHLENNPWSGRILASASLELQRS